MTLNNSFCSGKLIGNKKDERLSTLRFKNKDTIKIMGKAIKVDPGFASLKAYERNNLVKLNQQFEQNGQDLDLLEKNFLEGWFWMVEMWTQSNLFRQKSRRNDQKDRAIVQKFQWSSWKALGSHRCIEYLRRQYLGRAKNTVNNKIFV